MNNVLQKKLEGFSIRKLEEFKDTYGFYGDIDTIREFNKFSGLDLNFDEFKQLESLHEEYNKIK